MSSAKGDAAILMGDLSAEGMIYRALRLAAEQAKPAPTNPELAGRIGAESISTPPRILDRLAQRGAIVIERSPTERRITIVATGKATAVSDKFEPRHPAYFASRGRRIADAKITKEKTHSSLNPQASRRSLARRSGTVTHPVPIDRPTPELREAPPPDADRRPMAPSREPCPRCAIRGDLGCKHFAPFEPMMEDA